jgi:hypothetical protein
MHVAIGFVATGWSDGRDLGDLCGVGGVQNERRRCPAPRRGHYGIQSSDRERAARCVAPLPTPTSLAIEISQSRRAGYALAVSSGYDRDRTPELFHCVERDLQRANANMHGRGMNLNNQPGVSEA